MSDAISALATNMVDRKRSGTEPYIIFLGAGASISSGCSSMMDIVDDALQSQDTTQFKDWQKKIEEAALVNLEYGGLLKRQIDKQKREKFFEIWSRLDSDSKYPILRKHLWENKSPSDGYIDLANLIKMGYIKMIISTNLDNILEKALNNAGWYQPDDFIVIVNGKDRPDEVREQIESSHAPFKLVKLHGTLESPNSYAFTPEEVFDFEKTIKPSLSRIINQSLIIVGHSMQDRDIDMLFDDEGKEIHFVKPTRPETESRIDIILKVRQQGSIIDGESGNFDNFFRKLRLYIEKESDETKLQGSVQTIEGFLRSIGYEHELKVPHSRFRNLPNLYVKPTEYDDICSKLEKEHVVFIIGEPHLGKTYTALYLLWDYYQKGYETLHIRHDQLVSLLHQHDGEMKKLLLDLFASEKGLPRIIHFDDPFGETMERRTDAFAKELDNFLDLARGYEHLRVIVTTRLNIFRESMAEVHDLKKIAELEKDIRVHTSYRRDILLDILHRYTRFYKPLWASDEKIIAALDEQLPDLLPAPHNVEFFVRTSEKLTSLEEVLNHVEKSKEMIKALGEWMASLPDHQQLFLMWLEVCSTASILFPDTPASNMDFERAYLETLAYMFKNKHIDGIPISPFSRAKDKFNMILLESRDKESGSVRYDFVHPSYHEAFWYTKHKPAMRWWDLLKDNVGEILKDHKNKVDLVQLRMIELYGTINRDLDQLLLVSAESDDVDEQLIALEHMMERPEQFTNLPQFSRCMHSVISSKTLEYRYSFLNIVEKYLDKLPLDLLNAVPAFLFDEEEKVRQKAEEIILRHFNTLPKSVKQCDKMQAWRLVQKLFLSSGEVIGSKHDVISRLEEECYDGRKMKKLINRFVKMSPANLQILFRIENISFLKNILQIANNAWDTLSSEQIEVIPICDILASSKSSIVKKEVEYLILRHYEYFANSEGKYPFIRELNLLQQTFKLSILQIRNYYSPFKYLPIDDWRQISPDALKQFLNSSLPSLIEAIIQNILENYNQLSQKQRDVFVTSKSSLRFVEVLTHYIGDHKYTFRNVPDSAMLDLLSFPGYIQHIVLAGLLLRFELLSENDKLIINDLINNPPDWWVAGSIGLLTSKKRFETETKINEKIRDIPLRFSRNNNKRMVGALLAEMADFNFGEDHGLQEMFKPLLFELSKDKEIVRYAEEWMDYQFEQLGFYDKKHWSKVKADLRNLS